MKLDKKSGGFSRVKNTVYKIICMILGLDSTIRLYTTHMPTDSIDGLMVNTINTNRVMYGNEYQLCKKPKHNTTIIFKRRLHKRSSMPTNLAVC